MDHPSTLAEDLILHPELTPLLELDQNQNLVCFGWVSPIYTFDKHILDDEDSTQ